MNLIKYQVGGITTHRKTLLQLMLKHYLKSEYILNGCILKTKRVTKKSKVSFNSLFASRNTGIPILKPLILYRYH